MWLYQLFILPADTSESPLGALRVPEEADINVKGSYSFSTEGTSVDMSILGKGWTSKLAVKDVSGVSGEVKRIEDLQELSLSFDRGEYGAKGGILTQNLINGDAKGEGLEIHYKGDKLTYLRRYSPNRRVEIKLKEGFWGPYIFSERPVVSKSVKVYLNGRPLDRSEYEFKDNSIYLKTEYVDGDVLTVEYRDASLSPSHVLFGRIKKGRITLDLQHERPALKLFKGCTLTEGGDYIMRGDTFLFVPGRGDLECTFVPSEKGNYAFSGDRYYPSDSGGYTLIPPDTSPTSYFSKLALTPSFGDLSLTVGKIENSLAYGGRWSLRYGSSLILSTSGDVFFGKRPDISHYNVGRWGENYGEADLGITYTEGPLEVEGHTVLGVGDKTSLGYLAKGKYGMIFGSYERFPMRIGGELGGNLKGITLAYSFHWDTSSSYRGGKVAWNRFSLKLRKYNDGFLGYTLRINEERGSFYYSKTPEGTSTLAEAAFHFKRLRLRGKVMSGQSFVKQERFIYVGKGWGDYEKDSSGSFVPYPYGSYRKEVLYFPSGEPSYDFDLSVRGEGYGGEFGGKLTNRLEKYNLSLHTSGKTYDLSLLLYRDLTSDNFRSERSVKAKVGHPIYFKGEMLESTYAADSVAYMSGEVGYSRRWIDLGLEALKGKSPALSPIFRTRGKLSLEGGYRIYFGDRGNEIRYKPSGVFLSLALNLQRELSGVSILGSLTGGYDSVRRAFYTFSLGVRGEV